MSEYAPIAKLIRDALAFANAAAGEGLEIDGLSPEEFLFAYAEATGIDEWDHLPDMIADMVDMAIRHDSELSAMVESRAAGPFAVVSIDTLDVASSAATILSAHKGAWPVQVINRAWLADDKKVSCHHDDAAGYYGCILDAAVTELAGLTKPPFTLPDGVVELHPVSPATP